MRDIIAKLEELASPSREVDLLLLAHIQQKGEWGEGDIEYALTDIEGTTAPPPFTASLDAAVALVEQALPAQLPNILRSALNELSRKFAWHMTFAKAGQVDELPCAIVLVLLRALEQQEAK